MGCAPAAFPAGSPTRPRARTPDDGGGPGHTPPGSGSGRSASFCRGGGGRTAGSPEPETAKRLAGLVSQYDPAGLSEGPCEG
ncbi:hypothetical protein GCM10010231_38000 [Streptomyces sindenensis]|nr:hypothetical protein GCM10010231_38000 [Streptomyces sindenensis]